MREREREREKRERRREKKVSESVKSIKRYNAYLSDDQAPTAPTALVFETQRILPYLSRECFMQLKYINIGHLKSCLAQHLLGCVGRTEK